jgi:hypothetical protein
MEVLLKLFWRFGGCLAGIVDSWSENMKSFLTVVTRFKGLKVSKNLIVELVSTYRFLTWSTRVIGALK